jgi:hypothetical protein|tara:strand:- start:92 stop:652 length:561 start_codon:yes stop_codon:yes gene_type:complete
MAHFAEIRSDNNQVIRVVKKNDEDISQNGGEYTAESENWVAANTPEDPILKQEFSGTYPETYWKQCSYNTFKGVHREPVIGGDQSYDQRTPSEDQSKAKRKNYPAPGSFYNPEADGFYPEKVYDSWTLNETTFHWDPPIPEPTLAQTSDDGINWKYYPITWNETEGKWEGKDTDEASHFWDGSSWT